MLMEERMRSSSISSDCLNASARHNRLPTQWGYYYDHHKNYQPSESTLTVNEGVDFEVVAAMAAAEYEDSCSMNFRRSLRATTGGGSGLPLVCSNCGVSFFSLQITDDVVDCYCSGECKWSVIMYREMDQRLSALHRQMEKSATTVSSSPTSGSSYEHEETVCSGSFQYVDALFYCR